MALGFTAAYGAEGAVQGLNDILKQRMLERQQTQREKEAAELAAREQRQQNEIERRNRALEAQAAATESRTATWQEAQAKAAEDARNAQALRFYIQQNNQQLTREGAGLKEAAAEKERTAPKPLFWRSREGKTEQTGTVPYNAVIGNEPAPPSPFGATLAIQTVDENGNPVTRIVPRTPGSNFPGAMPAAMKEKREAYEQTLDLIDQIKAQGEKVGWKGIGPVQGTVGSAAFRYLGKGNPEEETLRSLMGQLKARASFQEGGKQFTGTEKALLDTFLAQITQNPEAAKTRLAAFEKSARRALHVMRPGVQPGVEAGPQPSAGQSSGTKTAEELLLQYGR